MATPENQPLTFDFIFSPSPHGNPDAPLAVFSIHSQRKCYLVEADGRTPVAHLRHAGVTQDMPYRSFSFPLYMLHAPLLFRRKASSMLHSSGFWVGTHAHHRILHHLCHLAPRHAEEATSRGYHKLHIVLDVQMQIPIVHAPLMRRLATLPPSASTSALLEIVLRQHAPSFAPPSAPTSAPSFAPPSAPTSAPSFAPPSAPTSDPHSDPRHHHMKIKELSDIASDESCPICFEEFQESTKMVTETPCSHLFHSDCLLPWLLSSTTCPLCRSTLRDLTDG